MSSFHNRFIICVVTAISSAIAPAIGRESQKLLLSVSEPQKGLQHYLSLLFNRHYPAPVVISYAVIVVRSALPRL
jgi:hypothetical protein